MANFDYLSDLAKALGVPATTQAIHACENEEPVKGDMGIWVYIPSFSVFVDEDSVKTWELDGTKKSIELYENSYLIR